MRDYCGKRRAGDYQEGEAKLEEKGWDEIIKGSGMIMIGFTCQVTVHLVDVGTRAFSDKFRGLNVLSIVED